MHVHITKEVWLLLWLDDARTLLERCLAANVSGNLGTVLIKINAEDDEGRALVTGALVSLRAFGLGEDHPWIKKFEAELNTAEQVNLNI